MEILKVFEKRCVVDPSIKIFNAIFQVVNCSGNTGHNVEYVLRLADWIRAEMPEVRVSYFSFRSDPYDVIY